MQINELKPLVVVVRRGMWQAIPSFPVATPRDKMLLTELKASGGINDKTPPGLYNFNIVPGSNGEVVVFLPIRLFA